MYGARRCNVLWVIVISFFLAFALNILPLPNWIVGLRPQWVLLLLMGWALLLPECVGIGVGWIVGLALDMLSNAYLGEHALIFTVVVYFLQRFHNRIVFYSFWQRTSIIFLLVLLAQILQVWLESNLEPKGNHINYWLTIFTTTLFWPWIEMLLRRWQERLRIS